MLLRAEGFHALIARTRTLHRPVGPVAYDCVKLIVVRDGSAILFSEFGQQPVRPGDVILLGPNVLCGSEPEEHITVTTIYADTDYVIDQVFWQHAGILHDRLDARGFTEKVYSDPAQILRLGEHRTRRKAAEDAFFARLDDADLDIDADPDVGTDSEDR